MDNSELAKRMKRYEQVTNDVLIIRMRSWEQQIYTGSVVLNRVNSNRYPDSIKDVVFDKGQYACTWDGNYDKEPSERSIEVAKYLLENGSQIPYYVLYQAEFKQGDEVWKQIGGYILLL